MGATTSPIDLIPGMWLTTYNYRLGGDGTPAARP